ncbi:MAG: preprotein translocase subunit SecY [Ruminococcaceae bacterium]|jgi:preprotein translocase subunit SecY|nr:preprotein translocase subunit SecY [Oscillospiraceae bacterium]
MIKTIINAFKIPELRKKLIFTAFIILVFRIGSVIPVPFLDIANEIDVGKGNSILTYFSLMTGSAFNYGTIFAMSITPYINASIIMQLLAVAIPALEKLQKEGEEGRKKINTITRFVTVVLGLAQSLAYYFYLRSSGYLMKDGNGVEFAGFQGVFQAIVIVAVLTAGTAVIMWLGEQITIDGIGNGISIILFAGIVSRFPTLIEQLKEYWEHDAVVAYKFLVPLVIVAFFFMIAYIVLLDNAERRLPIQYSKRVVGRKMYGGQNTHMPIKINMSGVLPIIFASSILSLPGTVQMFLKNQPAEDSFWGKFFDAFQGDSWWYAGMYFLLIIFFAYFYSTIQYNPIEMANNLRKNNGVIPGIRPGRPTSDYIFKILSRLTLIGALMISAVALFPIVYSLICAAAIPGNPDATDVISQNGGMSISLGGTSLIILVGVALETVRQLESQMMMRHYKGFLD